VNIFISGTQDNHEIKFTNHNLEYVSHDLFLSSIIKDHQADLFIWRYNFPWLEKSDFNREELESWNTKQTSFLAALKKTKKNVISINESLVPLSIALSNLLNEPNKFNSSNEKSKDKNAINIFYMSVISAWGKKYFNTFERLEKISLNYDGTKGTSKQKEILKSDNTFNLWLNFLSCAHKNNEEKNELQLKLNRCFKELATLTMLLESKQNSYESEIEKLVANNKALISKKESIKDEFNNYKNREFDLSSEISDKEKIISEIKKELITEKNNNQNYHKKIESLTIELNLCKQSLNSRFNELAVITGMLEASKREAIALEEKILLINSKNTNIKNSLSWKITAPIRALSNPTGVKKKENNKKKKAIQLIKNSQLFDSKWYLEQYSDVKATGIEPARHYLLFGGFENRDPSLKFSSQGYLDLYPDVKESGMNPLEHYIRYGEIEKRTIVTKQ